jgi:hypothetical protein
LDPSTHISPPVADKEKALVRIVPLLEAEESELPPVNTAHLLPLDTRWQPILAVLHPPRINIVDVPQEMTTPLKPTSRSSSRNKRSSPASTPSPSPKAAGEKCDMCKEEVTDGRILCPGYNTTAQSCGKVACLDCHLINVEEEWLCNNCNRNAKRQKTRDGTGGKTGKDGKDGKDGKEGKEGKKGKDGANGSNGSMGKEGKPGKDAKDGTSGAAEASGSLGTTNTPPI